MHPDRLQLVRTIMEQWYPDYSGLWLKAMCVSDVHPASFQGLPQAMPHAFLQCLLEDHFYQWTPESAPYSVLVNADWQMCSHVECVQRLDRMIARATKQVAETYAEEAKTRADAEAEGWSEVLPPSSLQDLMVDFPTLRRWLIEDLWADQTPLYWYNYDLHHPALIVMDDAIIAILWVP